MDDNTSTVIIIGMVKLLLIMFTLMRMMAATIRASMIWLLVLALLKRILLMNMILIIYDNDNDNHNNSN